MHDLQIVSSMKNVLYPLMPSLLEGFTFLRPWWLLAFLLLAVEVLISQWNKKSAWDLIVAPHLQSKVIERVPGRSLGQFMIRGLIMLAAVAMAGPSFHKVQVPLMVDSEPVVVVMDISLSMNAQDIRPSRLSRAKYLVEDLLKQSPNKPIGLIAFAEQVYTITPITSDHVAVLNLLKVLDSDLVPIQGSSTTLAVETAIERLQASRYGKGKIILLSDDMSLSSVNEIKTALEKTSFELITLFMSTRQGAIIPTQDGFVSDSTGAAVHVKVNPASVEALGQLPRSQVIEWENFRGGIKNLISSTTSIQEENHLKTHIQEDAGIYVLVLMLPLAALLFRRGWLVVWLMLPLIHMPQDCLASQGIEASTGMTTKAPPSHSTYWLTWWKDKNKQAMEAFEEQDYSHAADTFESQPWKAAAHYKAKDYQSALTLLEKEQQDISDKLKTAKGLKPEERFSLEEQLADLNYNRGNAFAQLGRYDDAISAYESVLEQDPYQEDAKYNLAIIKSIKDKPPQSDKSGKNEDANQKKDSDKSDKSDGKDNSQEAKDTSPSKPNDDSGDKNSETAPKKDDKDPTNQDNAKNTNEDTAKSEDEHKRDRPNPGDAKPDQSADSRQASEPISTEESKDEKEIKQHSAWLNTIEDDPSELLRRKFLYQYQQSARAKTKGAEPW